MMDILKPWCEIVYILPEGDFSSIPKNYVVISGFLHIRNDCIKQDYLIFFRDSGFPESSVLLDGWSMCLPKYLLADYDIPSDEVRYARVIFQRPGRGRKPSFLHKHRVIYHHYGEEYD